MTSHATAILQTLKYSDHFSFPLTLKEIHSRLIGVAIGHIRLTSQIRLMVKKGSITQTGDYFHLPGRSTLVTRRLSRHNSSLPQLSRATMIASKLSRVPGVLAIYLTGSLAMANSGVDDDIDFMIITRNHRLWTTRALLTLYTELLGLRRRPRDPHTAGKACLNLYLSPLSYLLPPGRRSLYTAYELIQAVPLYDPSDTRADLLSANPWIYNHLPNLKGTVPKRNAWLQAKQGSSADEGTVPKVMRFIEPLAYRLQLTYMRPHLTREYITRDSAFFHPHNPAPKI